MPAVFKDFLSYCLSHEQSSNTWAPLAHNINGHTTLESPLPGVLIARPNDAHSSQKQIVLSSGIHGNETAPIEICNKLIADIANESLRINHSVLFMFGNLPAIIKQTRFIEENMNRLFKPDLSGDSLEVPRAKALMQVMQTFFEEGQGQRHHYDLHTAIRASKNEKFAVYPYLHGQAHNKSELQFMSDCGVNTILLSQTPTTTFSYYSSRYHQAHSFTVELGKVKPFGENDMTKFAEVDLMLRHLLQDEVLALTPYAECPLQIYRVNQVINKRKEDFSLHFSDDTANFTDFSKGSLLASEDGKEYLAEHDGEAVVFPNANVAIGQRALLTVIPCEL